MKDNNNINFYIVINHQDKEYQLLVNYSLTVSKLKKIIMTYFKFSKSQYEIYYKNLKLDNNDSRLLSLFFEKDTKPLLYIFNSKNDILPDSKKQTYLTLFTNIPDLKMNEIVEKFFEYKKMKNDAYIKISIKGMFIINFSKASLCSDFKEFYDNYLRLNKENPYRIFNYRQEEFFNNSLNGFIFAYLNNSDKDCSLYAFNDVNDINLNEIKKNQEI